ncbi:hypothetical protein EUTSA_v10012014mg, partial [Eutrema salsugineum]
YFNDIGAEQGKAMEFHFIRGESTTPSGLPYSPAFTSFFMSDYFKNRPSKPSITSPDQLCGNIGSGHVSEWITDLDCRSSVSAILGGPNLILADVIEQECSLKSWEGIIKRLWPKAKRIECIITGQMAQYTPILESYSNNLHLESHFGINVDPLCKPQDVSYIFVPNVSYFEFLPVDHDGDMASIVDLVNVKLGCYYEPLVTNYFGLNRYLIDSYVRRKNVVLGVDTEATTEEDILKALAHANLLLESSDVMLIGVTCYADISTFPDRGVNDVVEVDKKVLVKCCSVLEESFNVLYRRFRGQGGSIGALEIRVVQQGTLDSLMEYFISQGGSTTQYKTPICINSSEALAVLENRVLDRFYSESSPPLGV